MADFEMDHQCPYCGTVNEVASGVNAAGGPAEGSLSLCWRCAHIGVFDDAGKPRQATPEEFDEFMADPDVVVALAALHVAQTPIEAVEMAKAITGSRDSND